MSQAPTFGLFGTALALLSPALFAQSSADTSSIAYQEAAAVLETWNQDHGSNWRLFTDKQTGYAEMIYGGSAAPSFEPTSDDDFADLGILAIEATAGMHGIEAGTLILDRGLHLPLGLMGSNDKFTVRYHQEVNGVPVIDGSMNTLFNMQGELLSIQTNAMPNVASMGTTPSISPTAAEQIALDTFERELGLPGTVTGSPLLAIGQLDVDLNHRDAVLIYEINVGWTGLDMEPEGETYWVSAKDGRVLRQRTSIHYCDVGGTLSTRATPGLEPDTGSNPEVLMPMNHADVTASGGGGTVRTDEFGNFNFPGLTGPVNVTFKYKGDWIDVFNAAGPDHSEVVSLTGTGNQVTMNSTPTQSTTAQSNIFVTLGAMHDWIKAINPSDNSWPSNTVGNAGVVGTCNAYYNGNSVNFFDAQSGAGCPNTAYSTVIAHEMGHWLNDRYSTRNGPDGIGEGNADVFGLYMFNSPLLGFDFLGPGSGPLRSGDNTEQFCGDSNPGCLGGGVHNNGKPWMGAAWKVHKRIELAFGASEADTVTDHIFLGWMNAFDQTGITSAIEPQWLILDDDDGNLNNGTLHYEAIDAGFKQQGWPGVFVARTDIQVLSSLDTQNSEFGPYVVDAFAKSGSGLTVQSMDLVYMVNGGNSITLPMTSSGVDTWTVGIPGYPSPAIVEFYLRARDSGGFVEISPRNAPTETYNFGIGVAETILTENFQNQNIAWTSGSFMDTSNHNSSWERDVPAGLGGDPWEAASGTRCWGNELKFIQNPSLPVGLYQSNVHNFLQSPSMDLSSTARTFLRFNRWLTVEGSNSDKARVLVNGTEVWVNPPGQALLDREWKPQLIEITAAAAGSADVRVEFTLKTDGGLNFGGWNVDDFEVFELKPASDVCQASIPYGLGKENSWFAYPQLRAISPPSEGAGSFNFRLTDAMPSVPGIIFSSPIPASVPFAGGTRLVGNPITREHTFFTDQVGTVIVPQEIAVGASGTSRFFQAWYRDVNHTDGTGIGLSDGVEVIFCD